ncbi:uncharacterized protein J4E84_004939 [Alternaria hordeiaustralica]|uniref:uncharacterized protein n=1 Tax=Alternaria hordeiaustralica TaxID=1187925 RepID=UPI0020C56187|nr:uncharacterized protein J4E84_004939 [Alternaria hordeiaustralica]KAI4688011.1 hypothetical protein J4E84_004939 [Alternaria hordeiaustralica]
MVRRGFAADAAFTKKNMITFKVGHGGKAVFLVPEDRIRASSEFVDAAMRGPWQESQERVITLPDFDIHTFGIYFQWLVTGVVHSKSYLADGNDPALPLFTEMLLLPKLSDLGHYLLDTDFRDTLNDVLIQCTVEIHRSRGGRFPPNFGSDFYHKTPDQSPTRKLVTALAAWEIQEFHFPAMEKERDTVNTDYMMDLLIAVTRRLVPSTRGKSPLDGWETSCKYHCHGDEKPCYRKKADTSRVITTKRPAPDDAQSSDAKRRA